MFRNLFTSFKGWANRDPDDYAGFDPERAIQSQLAHQQTPTTPVSFVTETVPETYDSDEEKGMELLKRPQPFVVTLPKRTVSHDDSDEEPSTITGVAVTLPRRSESPIAQETELRFSLRQLSPETPDVRSESSPQLRLSAPARTPVPPQPSPIQAPVQQSQPPTTPQPPPTQPQILPPLQQIQPPALFPRTPNPLPAPRFHHKRTSASRGDPLQAMLNAPTRSGKAPKLTSAQEPTKRFSTIGPIHESSTKLIRQGQFTVNGKDQVGTSGNPYYAFFKYVAGRLGKSTMDDFLVDQGSIQDDPSNVLMEISPKVFAALSAATLYVNNRCGPRARRHEVDDLIRNEDIRVPFGNLVASCMQMQVLGNPIRAPSVVTGSHITLDHVSALDETVRILNTKKNGWSSSTGWEMDSHRKLIDCIDEALQD